MGAPAFISMTIFLLMFTFDSKQGVDGASEYGVLDARSSEKSKSDLKLSVCIVFNTQYQSLPSDTKKTHFHRLANLSHSEGCSVNDYNTSDLLVNKVVAVARGGCSFIQKARVVESINGAAVLVVDYRNASHATYPGGNASEFKSINITLAVISFEDYRSILAVSRSIDVSLYNPSNPLWDANMLLMIVLSTVLVVMGAAWAAYDEWYFLKVTKRRSTRSNNSQNNDQDGGTGMNDSEITVMNIMIWFALICSMILLLYYFYDYIVYFFIGVFCVAGTYSLYHCLLPLWSWCLPVTYDIPVDRLPCIKTKVKLRSFLLLLLCSTVGIFWVVQRHAKYAWIFQDLLGAAFCIFFMHTLRLPNLKIIAIFLLMLLVYDVFFVFITPHFTSDGTSIMESVATGGRGHSKESLPMVFLLPTLSNMPVRKCMDREFSLLGFGDIIIPGLLVAYNAAFDVKTGNRMVYYISSSIGYFVGMIVCIVSLMYMNTGQPALLFLVPGTLFTTIAVALVRKEFHQLFFGLNKQKPKNDVNIQSENRENEEADIAIDCPSDEEKNLIK